MKMKIWILRPVESLPADDNPWNPWYDKAFGFVVRAASEQQARELAQEQAGDEDRGDLTQSQIEAPKTPWIKPKYSTCKELLDDGEAGVVMRDFAAA